VKESGSYQSLANDDKSIFAGLLRTADRSTEPMRDGEAIWTEHSTLQNQNSKLEEVLA
jgi:hypothetical protein